MMMLTIIYYCIYGISGCTLNITSKILYKELQHEYFECGRVLDSRICEITISQQFKINFIYGVL